MKNYISLLAITILCYIEKQRKKITNLQFIKNLLDSIPLANKVNTQNQKEFFVLFINDSCKSLFVIEL